MKIFRFLILIICFSVIFSFNVLAVKSGSPGGSGTGAVIQSDCSTIISGFCIDVDDGIVYYYNPFTSLVSLLDTGYKSGDSPTFGDISADTLTLTSIATPLFSLYDSDAAGTDKADELAATWEANFTTTTEDAEVSDVNFTYMNAGTKTNFFHVDGSENKAYSDLPLNSRPTYITDADGITLSAAQMNSVVYETTTGDVDIPDGECNGAEDVGKWIVVITDAADQNSLTSLDASNQFIITDNASALTAGNELDIDGTMVCVMCIAAELWKVTGYMGAVPTDGGAAD